MQQYYFEISGFAQDAADNLGLFKLFLVFWSEPVPVPKKDQKEITNLPIFTKNTQKEPMIKF